MELSVIIVSYNTADQIGRCLVSLERSPCCSREIIVVDNASGDDSPAFIRGNHPDVLLIANKENRGFAQASNQALAAARGRYILFLNPDTEVLSGSLREMITFMETNPHVGLAGPKIINPDGSLQESVSTCYPGQRLAGTELKELPGAIACVLGAAMIARRDLLLKLGGFDEEFFLYGEDQDLCLRIRKAGWTIGYTESARVMHRGAQSERATPSCELWRKKTRAEYLFYRKHYFTGTVGRIARRELLKARFRLAVLTLTGPFASKGKERMSKIAKYRALIEELGL